MMTKGMVTGDTAQGNGGEINNKRGNPGVRWNTE